MKSERGQLALVTGASGFTGTHLARELRRRGLRVRAFVRSPERGTELAETGVGMVRGDIRDARAVMDAAAGVDVVYHLAAVYRTAGHPDSYYRDVNVGGTENILAAARRHGVSRVVHCSTVGVHGHVADPPADERAPFNPGDVYQRTKLEGERRASSAFGAGLPGSIFRPAAIYGPGDTRLLKLFRAIQHRRFRMFGPGDAHYHLVYIDDLIDGIIRCGTMEAALGDVFILAGPRSTTLDELAALVAGVVGVRPARGRLPLWPLLAASAFCEAVCRPVGVNPPLHRRRADFFVKNRSFTSARAQGVLGYVARVGLADGLARTARWYASRGLIDPLPAPREAMHPPAPGLAAQEVAP